MATTTSTTTIAGTTTTTTTLVANGVIKRAGLIIEVSEITADIDLCNELGWDNLSIHSMQLIPGGANDKIAVKQGGAAGPTLFFAEAAAVTDMRIKYFHQGAVKPFIDFSGCTLSEGAKLIIITH